MRLLVINCGSSTLKYEVLEVSDAGPPHSVQHGLVDRIGERVPDHAAAVRQVLDAVTGTVEAVGHRVVHGGSRFAGPVRIDAEVIGELQRLEPLAPLHNPPAIAAIQACRDRLGPAIPMVACFDTAFHATLPPRAFTYALPHDLAARHQVRRYGFHGLAHEAMLRRFAQVTGRSLEAVTIVTLQLGNGCSACAIKRGRSIDTSMGFTPLEGFVMGTRSGDLDPALVSYLALAEGISAAEVETLLNQRSGLLGVSGLSGDVRDLLAAKQAGHAGATLALDVFTYRARKYLGAYLTALGGAQAVVFGGGIGEHAPWIRSEIAGGMEWPGLQLDAVRNEQALGQEALISTDGSTIQAWVLPVNETHIIAEQVFECLRHQPQ